MASPENDASEDRDTIKNRISGAPQAHAALHAVSADGNFTKAFESDPRYQRQRISDNRLYIVEKLRNKGGTFSVMALVSTRLQMLYMRMPTRSRNALERLAESFEPVLGWFQQELEFESQHEVSQVRYGSQHAPKTFPEAFKTLPRGPQRPPRGPPEAPRGPEEASQMLLSIIPR